MWLSRDHIHPHIHEYYVNADRSLSANSANSPRCDWAGICDTYSDDGGSVIDASVSSKLSWRIVLAGRVSRSLSCPSARLFRERAYERERASRTEP